jgi:hypothetical protein
MTVRKKFVVVDTRGTVPLLSFSESICAIDRVRIQYDLDLQLESNRDLSVWSTVDVFKDGLGFVYICAIMWMDKDNDVRGW